MIHKLIQFKSLLISLFFFFSQRNTFLPPILGCCHARSSTTGKEKVSVTDPITEWVHLALAQSRMDPFSQDEQPLRSDCSGQSACSVGSPPLAPGSAHLTRVRPVDRVRRAALFQQIFRMWNVAGAGTAGTLAWNLNWNWHETAFVFGLPAAEAVNSLQSIYVTVTETQLAFPLRHVEGLRFCFRRCIRPSIVRILLPRREERTGSLL